MPSGLIRKNRVVLTEYDCERDINTRLLFSTLTPFDVRLLTEIIDNSLKFSIEELVDLLEASESEIKASLEKVAQTKLCQLQGKTLLVNKDVRKYLEKQVEKFHPQFRPGMEFLEDILSQVSPNTLCNWYALPKASDDIFTMIVDKYLLTPKRYQRYLHELCSDVDHPWMKKIIPSLFDSENLELDVEELKAKLEMTARQFHEFILLLEFNFVCCLVYKQVEGVWKEYLVPLDEWQKYLEFKKKTLPVPLAETKNIEKKHPEPFGFLKDLEETLHSPSKNSSTPLIEKALQLKFLSKENGQLSITLKGKEWIEKTFEEKAMDLYFHTLSSHRYYSEAEVDQEYSDREIREVEKSLKVAINSNWIYFDDFVKGVTAAIGEFKPVSLKQKGKRWAYATPTYGRKEHEFIHSVIFGHLFECGMVMVGSDNKRDCFAVTPFGKSFLSD